MGRIPLRAGYRVSWWETQVEESFRDFCELAEKHLGTIRLDRGEESFRAHRRRRDDGALASLPSARTTTIAVTHLRGSARLS